METDLTPDQEFLTETTRRFLDAKVTSSVVRGLRDDPHGYDPSSWREGCELGWTSLLVREEDGGGTVSGDGVSDLALLAFEFGRHAAPGPLIAVNVVADALSREGTPEQKATVLDGLLSGRDIATWVHAGPGAGAPHGPPGIRATDDGGDWRLDGRQEAVEVGGDADTFLVSARSGDGFVQFLVPAATDGIAIQPMQSVDLTRRFASVEFSGTRVGADAVVGAPGDASPAVRRQLQVANALQCAEMVGAMDRAFEITVEWAFDRYSFGRPLASYQVLKHRFADMKTWLEASHALADGAAHSVGAEDPGADEVVSAAKAYIGHYGPELCQECVQLHGGIGVTYEHDLHLYLRRVVVDAVLFGTVRDHRLRLTDILQERAETQRGAA
jgi:alkylation response protein AidB-like acyl-CoA dehydrogenase